MKKGRIFRKTMCFIMACSIILSSYSVPIRAENSSEDEYLEEKISSLADFEAVDNLIEQRVDALTEGNMNQYRNLSEDLKEYGCEDISAKEVQKLTGKAPEDLLKSQYQNRTNNSGISLFSAASTNVTFTKVITKVKYKGKKYKVMKITAAPTDLGTLYNTGSVTQSYKGKSIKAETLGLLNTVAGFVAPESKAVQSISLFFALGGVLGGLKKTSQIEKVKVNYTWSVEEICSFIYVYDKRVKNYGIGVSYNKAKYIVAMDIPNLKVKNGKRYSNIEQKKYSRWITAPNYGSANKAVSYFKKGTAYNSWVYNVKMSGCNGKNIRNVYLQHPSTAMQLGYWN